MIAPVLSTSLNDGARLATKATTAEVLDSSVSLRTKVSLAFDLRDLVADAPRGEVPDPTVPFDKRGAAHDAKLRATRDGVVAAIRDTLTARVSIVVPHRRAVRDRRRVRGGRRRGSLRNRSAGPLSGGAFMVAGVIVALVSR